MGHHPASTRHFGETCSQTCLLASVCTSHGHRECIAGFLALASGRGPSCARCQHVRQVGFLMICRNYKCSSQWLLSVNSIFGKFLVYNGQIYWNNFDLFYPKSNPELQLYNIIGQNLAIDKKKDDKLPSVRGLRTDA